MDEFEGQVMVDDLQHVPIHDRFHILIEVAESLLIDAEEIKKNLAEHNAPFENRRASMEFLKESHAMVEDVLKFYNDWHDSFAP